LIHKYNPPQGGRPLKARVVGIRRDPPLGVASKAARPEAIISRHHPWSPPPGGGASPVSDLNCYPPTAAPSHCVPRLSGLRRPPLSSRSSLHGIVPTLRCFVVPARPARGMPYDCVPEAWGPHWALRSDGHTIPYHTHRVPRSAPGTHPTFMQFMQTLWRRCGPYRVLPRCGNFQMRSPNGCQLNMGTFSERKLSLQSLTIPN